MSILKAILHHYNSTSKSYDTLHPETESAQITDWHKAVVNSLASTTLPAVVSALTTDSVMGKLMKLLLNASGVKYLIDTNGYICFGSFFGGLIIQWGYFKENEWCTLPIAFTESLITLATHESANVDAAKDSSYVCTTVINENKIYIYTPVDKNNSSNAIMICH